MGNPPKISIVSTVYNTGVFWHRLSQTLNCCLLMTAVPMGPGHCVIAWPPRMPASGSFTNPTAALPAPATKVWTTPAAL